MKHLSESLDSFGLPSLVESYDVEVGFEHQGRQAIALFGIDVSATPIPGSREFPSEEGHLDVVLLDVWDKESDEDIDPEVMSEKEKDDLADQAAEKFWDQVYPEIQRGEG